MPAEVRPYCALTKPQIVDDSDEGAAEIYDLRDEVTAFVTTDVARAIVDVNRAEDDRRPDGVVKTCTCWQVPVYQPFPPADVIATLLARYYRPYHQRLDDAARRDVVLGIDGHTMAAKGPPIGPGPGIERPKICLSNADGTCPQIWFESLAACLERAFGCAVSMNDPFKGGYIIRSHTGQHPWVQVELSRAPFLPNARKRRCLLTALREWIKLVPTCS